MGRRHSPIDSGNSLCKSSAKSQVQHEHKEHARGARDEGEVGDGLGTNHESLNTMIRDSGFLS